MTLVAVIADTHLPRGARRLPDECLSKLEAAALILHAGDLAAVSVLDELNSLGPVEAVYGNADEPKLRERLPKQIVVEVEQTRIGMTHAGGPAAGRDGRLVARFPGCDAVVYGHTHVPEVERVGEVWVLNPGSPTERRRAPIRSMLVLRVEGRTIEPELIALGA